MGAPSQEGVVADGQAHLRLGPRPLVRLVKRVKGSEGPAAGRSKVPRHSVRAGGGAGGTLLTETGLPAAGSLRGRARGPRRSGEGRGTGV